MTVTSSFVPPTSSLKSSATFVPTATSMSDETEVLKLAAVALTSYVSGGNCDNLYCPSSFDVTGRVRFVAFDFTVTVACGTPAPVGSVTAPSMVPVGVCASATADKIDMSTASDRRLASHLLNSLFI